MVGDVVRDVVGRFNVRFRAWRAEPSPGSAGRHSQRNRAESFPLNPSVMAANGYMLPVILISHNMLHVFEVADRIHIQRLGRRATVITPKSHTMSEAVAIMTGAMSVEE